MDPTTGQVNDFSHSDSEDPEVIRARIEATRAGMSQTVDSIQHRLSPERLTRQAKESIKEATIGKVEDMTHNATQTAKGWRKSLVRSIKDNPVPAALAGLGLTWLFMSGPDDDDYENGNTYRQYPTRNVYGQPHYTRTAHNEQGVVSGTVDHIRHQAGEITSQTSEMAGQVRDQAGEIAGQVKDQAQELSSQAQAQAHALAQQTQDQMHYYADLAQYQAKRAQRGFNQMLDENPLTLGAMALAVGAAIGLSLPSTRKEDEWMGETRDHLMNQAQSQAQQTINKAQRVVSEVADDVQHSAQKVVDTTKEAAESAKETAKKEAEKQNLTQS